MPVQGITDEVVAQFAAWEFDWIIEKHEGPYRWSEVLRWLVTAPLDLGGYAVLLPVEQDRHPNISALRVLPGADGETLTLFLRDTSYRQWDAGAADRFWAGHLAICVRVPRTALYVAVVYHACFLARNPLLEDRWPPDERQPQDGEAAPAAGAGPEEPSALDVERALGQLDRSV